ncbi:MAG: chromosomal replication initiator protein DnaA [Clostridia bacterium]|nr:chromosomal replication initiator protein DnaA [Clostridia bacterium]
MDYLAEIKEIWSMVQDKMKQQLGTTAMNLWFGDIEIISFSNYTLTLMTSTEFKMQIINEKYLSQLEDIFKDLMGFSISISVVSKNPSVNVDKIKNQISSEDIILNREESVEHIETPTVLGSTMPTVNFEYTFDNFIVGSSNKFAHAACIAVADKPAQDYNPLFIYGPSGLGKTHLLYAVTNEIKTKNPFANIIYIKGEDFTNQMIESLAKKSMSKFRDKYRTCDVLLIDDIQFIAGKESTQEEFFHTFNALYEEGKQIILTSDRPPKDIKTLEDRLKTRFEWGLIADIQPPDLELRIAIFKNKISQAGITISDEIITYLAENLRSHIRQIEGAVKKLVAIKFLSGSEITMDIAKNCMTELLGGAEPVNVTVDKIFSAIEKKYDVGKTELIGKSRVKDVAQARHVAIYLVRTITEMSLPNIGKLFNRDHSTVISSIDTIEKKISSSPAIEIEINELIKEIKE